MTRCRASSCGSVAALNAGTIRLSQDGSTWSEQLRIPLGQIGPAACNGRCFVAGGRILLAPAVLPDPEPPRGADESSPYYCEFLGPADQCGKSNCIGATVAECREGVRCQHGCMTASDCPAADSGKPRIECAQTQIGGQCFLNCDATASCPNGMSCEGGTCYYVYDDPRCVSR